MALNLNFHSIDWKINQINSETWLLRETPLAYRSKAALEEIGVNHRKFLPKRYFAPYLVHRSTYRNAVLSQHRRPRGD